MQIYLFLFIIHCDRYNARHVFHLNMTYYRYEFEGKGMIETQWLLKLIFINLNPHVYVYKIPLVDCCFMLTL